MAVTLEAIKFNHDPASATIDAINIRKNETELVPVPEWLRGKGLKPDESFPAAYAISETLGNTITIQAKFKRHDPKITSIEVRAVDPSRDSLISEVEDCIEDFVSWLVPSTSPSKRNVLGRVKRKRVTFRDNDETGFETFELGDVRIWDVGVSASTITWRWQYRINPEAHWIDLNPTTHRVYTILKLPNLPWLQYPKKGEETQLPWAAALEVACEWSKGARNLDAVTSQITRALRKLENTHNLVWSPSPHYSDPNFDCTAFLRLLQKDPRTAAHVNCSDLATILSSFANILGGTLWQSSMGANGSFFTNPVRLFGRTCWLSVEFTGHEVAWSGACNENEDVFDACLEVDGDADPSQAPHVPHLPTKLRFGEIGDRQYLFRLASPSNRANVPKPFPDNRTRRPIGPAPRLPGTRTKGKLLHAAKVRYDYASWQNPSPIASGLFLHGFFLEKTKLLNWSFLSPHVVTTSNRPSVIQTFANVIVDYGEALICMDIDRCSSACNARHFLMQRLASFDTPTLTQRDDLRLGEIAFVESLTGAVLFARANLVCLIRNARNISFDLCDLAQLLDQHISQRLDSQVSGSMQYFSIPSGTFRVGDSVPLTADGKRNEQFFKFFFESGAICSRQDALTYRPSLPGLQKLEIFAVASGGETLKQHLEFEVAAH